MLSEICRHIGDGLISFLQKEQDSLVMLTKTPSVRNLKHFFRFFPDAKLIIIIRDGRSVVESGVRSFKDWSRENAMHWWAKAARAILEFDKREKQHRGNRYLITKYENLILNQDNELKRILGFLGLDVEGYNFGKALNLPLRGSSSERGDKSKVHWEPVVKSSRFSPLDRWKLWDDEIHNRFNYIAGKEMLALGYQIKKAPTNRLWWTLKNALLDAAYLLKYVWDGSINRSNKLKEKIDKRIFIGSG